MAPAACGALSVLEQAQPIHAGLEHADDDSARLVRLEKYDMRSEWEAMDGREEAFQRSACDAGKLGEELESAVQFMLITLSLWRAELLEPLRKDVFEVGNRFGRKPILRHGPSGREPSP